jgi:hypothetical protein
MRPVDYIPRIRDNFARLGFKAYNRVINPDTAPWAPLRKPLSQCRLGLAASGGVYATGQVAFHYKDEEDRRLAEEGGGRPCPVCRS